MRLRYKTPSSLCPYCCKPVGILGNWLAKGFGTKMHNCDFSNVMSPEEIQKERELEYIASFLREIEKETKEHWQQSDPQPRVDKLLVKLSVIHEALKVIIIPKIEKYLEDKDNTLQTDD